MTFRKWELLVYIFNCLCIGSTAGLIAFWIYKFTLNEDLSFVEYKEYNSDTDDYYPSLSLCFRNPFVNYKRTYMNGSERLRLEAYLLGNEEGTEMSYDNYNKLTFDLTDQKKLKVFRR